MADVIAAATPRERPPADHLALGLAALSIGRGAAEACHTLVRRDGEARQVAREGSAS